MHVCFVIKTPYNELISNRKKLKKERHPQTIGTLMYIFVRFLFANSGPYIYSPSIYIHFGERKRTFSFKTTVAVHLSSLDLVTV